MSITIGHPPDDATLTAGTQNLDGPWTFSSPQEGGMRITSASGVEPCSLPTFTATTNDGGDLASTTGSITVSVAEHADAPSLSVSDASGTEEDPKSVV